MAAWCLPPIYASKFLDALRSGKLDPGALTAMNSSERRSFFADLVGEENAREVNAQFESKLLLKDQQRGLVSWAQKVAGITEPARRDLLSKIQNLDKVLQPADENAFLADLAASKLGVTVTADEAQRIFDASSRTAQAKALMQQDIGNVENRVAYGRSVMDLNDTIEEMKPHGMSFGNRIVDVLSIPKSALTSIFHFSAPFVQGWGMMSTKRAWEAFGQMFNYFRNEENFKNLTAYIISHPDFPLAADGGLGLTKLGDKLSAREEAIQSTLVEQANTWLSKNTGVPNLVRASSRSFTGYLNYVRFNRFTDLLNAARLAGEDVRPGSQVLKDLAQAVNDFTGRGNLGPGDKYGTAAPALNAMFFSPRKIAATVQMFNPVRYLDPRVSPTARKAAFRQLTGSLIATGAVLSVAKAMGASVDMDPRSSNFAKIQIGDEKLDMTGGNAVYTRLLARIATNQEITSSGKLITLGQGYKPETRAGLIATFLRDKLAPVATFITDALYGSDPVGRPFSVTEEMKEHLIPITIHDFINFATQDADNTVAIFPALSAIFGVSLESPLPPMTRTGLNVWGQSNESPSNFRADPVQEQLKKIGYNPSFPPQTINGVPLTDAQYHEYIQTSGTLAKQLLDQSVGNPSWTSLPPGVQAKSARAMVATARKSAASLLMMEYPTIIQRSLAAKQLALTQGGEAPP